MLHSSPTRGSQLFLASLQRTANTGGVLLSSFLCACISFCPSGQPDVCVRASTVLTSCDELYIVSCAWCAQPTVEFRGVCFCSHFSSTQFIHLAFRVLQLCARSSLVLGTYQQRGQRRLLQEAITKTSALPLSWVSRIHCVSVCSLLSFLSCMFLMPWPGLLGSLGFEYLAVVGKIVSLREIYQPRSGLWLEQSTL